MAVAAFAVACVLAPMSAHAQWWRGGPKDFEDCADLAEKAKTREDKTAQLADCNAKFAGRRKPGGGYTYYDFMQDRSFDIAGPNPTPDEQKKIDQEYTGYLEQQRRSRIVAAFNAKQLERQETQPVRPPQIQQASLHNEPARSEIAKVPVPAARPVQAAGRGRPYSRTAAAGKQLHEGYVLLRMAAAFRGIGRPEEAVHADTAATDQGCEAKLTVRLVIPGLAQARTRNLSAISVEIPGSSLRSAPE
ncbi:hypothetical protein [Bradyrhizobium sp. USDA 4510]